MFYVYTLRSKKNGKHYYGHTKNLERRLLKHNTNKDRSRFTPLEKAADFNRWSSPIEADGGLKPPSVQTVRERSSLTGFTCVDGPWELVFSKEFSSRVDAMRFEKFLKTGKGREYIKEQIKRFE